MEFGVFDHLDHGTGPLADPHEMRLALIERYATAGFRGYHLAEHHATGLGAAPSPAVLLAAAGGDAANPPRLGMTRHMVIAEDGAEAPRIARRAYKPWRAALYRPWGRHGSAPIGISFPRTYDELMENGQAIAGTPSQVGEIIRAQAEEAGINYFLCRFAFGDISLAEASRSVALFEAPMAAMRDP